MSDEKLLPDPLPCPFCGRKPSEDLIDTLYPTGSEWVDHEDGIRGYVRHRHGERSGLPWGRVWCMECSPSEGGCGASITADSDFDAITAWNRRAILADRARVAQRELSEEEILTIAQEVAPDLYIGMHDIDLCRFARAIVEASR